MAALVSNTKWYVKDNAPTSTIGWSALPAWTALTSYTAGQIVRQLAAPTVGNERAFICIIAGTTLASEPAWNVTKGSTTAEAAGPTWQECTGQPAVNGDATNTANWNAAKTNTVALGQIIQRINGVSYQICTTAGTAGSGAEPSFSDTAGVTTADNTVTWTSLGVVGNFSAWQAPHARLVNAKAATWEAAGDTIWISKNHTETQATTMTILGQGSNTVPCYNICVDDSTAPPAPPVATGASIATTGASSITPRGFNYYQGATLQSGSGASSSSININGTNAQAGSVFENCTLKLGNTNAASRVSHGSGSTNDSGATLINTAIVFGAVGQSVAIGGGRFNIFGGSIALTGSAPTIAFVELGASVGLVKVRDCDLSGIAGTIFSLNNTTNCALDIENCKIASGVTMTGATNLSSDYGGRFRLHNCDSGTKNYRFYENSFNGAIQSETTTVRSGGATDGVTPISWNIASGASVNFKQPYISPEIAIWNDGTGGSVTATVEIASSLTLTNADAWMEIEYLGSSSFPIGTRVVNRVADTLTTAANITSSAASWGGSPASTQKLQITFTPQMKGVVKARIYIARASTTIYVDPLITIT